MNVLCIAQQSSLWQLHGLHERCLLRGLMERGANVDYYVCNGGNALCDMGGKTSFTACSGCFATTTVCAEKMGLPWHPLYGPSFEGMGLLAQKWVNSLRTEELVVARYKDYPLGEWMYTSMLTAWNMPEYIPGVNDEQDRFFKELLRDACMNFIRVREIFEEKRYDTVILFNGRIMINNIIFHLGREKNVSVYMHERGGYMGSMRLIKTDMFHSHAQYISFWNEWKDIPLTPGQVKATHTYLMRREHGDPSVLNWGAFSTIGPLPEHIADIAKQKKLWVLFTSTLHEFEGLNDFANTYYTQSEWLEALIAEVVGIPDVHLVIRAHPNLAPSSASPGSESEMQWYAEFARRHAATPNLTVIQPNETISSYALMNAADAGFVSFSTCGLEMAAKGVPVGYGGAPVYGMAGVAHKANTPETLKDVCALFATYEKGRKNPEVQRRAWRFFYMDMYRRSLPLPMVLMPTPHVGHLVDYDQSRFIPGRTPELDRIVEWIINDEQPIPKPTADELAADADEEMSLIRKLALEKAHGPAFVSRKPRVSVIMSVYNGQSHLEESVGSILGQSFEDFECIIVDDASTDNTASLLKSFSDPRIKVIRNERNMERAYSRNLAVQSASASLLAIMDADDFSMPERLERQFAVMESSPDITLCGSFMAFYETHELHRTFIDNEHIRIGLLSDNTVPHPTWVVRKEVFQRMGGYRQHYVPSEDYDFLARASHQAGFRFYNIPEILLRYRVYPHENRQKYHEIQLERANRVRLFLLHKLIPGIKKEDLTTHLILCRGASREVYEANRLRVQEWMKRLVDANRNVGLYEQTAFEQWVDGLYFHC